MLEKGLELLEGQKQNPKMFLISNLILFPLWLCVSVVN